MPETIDNPRSAEVAVPIDRYESRLLDLDLCWMEPQSDTAIAIEFEVGRAFPDAFKDGYRSLKNLCHQLHSLDRLWSMLRLLGAANDDLVLLLRPDLFYRDALDPMALAPLLDGRTDLIVPAWQSWGGLNDRFAFCTVRAAEIYATRIQDFVDACVTLGGMHSESFLSLVARRHGLRVSTTAMRAARVRANGQVASNDVSELTDVAQMHEPVAA